MRVIFICISDCLEIPTKDYVKTASRVPFTNILDILFEDSTQVGFIIAPYARYHT